MAYLRTKFELESILEPSFKTEISCTTLKIGIVMLVTIQLVLLCVVAVPRESFPCIRFPGLGDATHTHHTYHTTNICHNVVLGSYWSITSLYSIVPSLGEPSQPLVTSQSYLAFYKYIMPNPAEEEGARASNIQLVIKYQVFLGKVINMRTLKHSKIGPPSSWRSPTRMYKKWTRLQLY